MSVRHRLSLTVKTRMVSYLWSIIQVFFSQILSFLVQVNPAAEQ